MQKLNFVCEYGHVCVCVCVLEPASTAMGRTMRCREIASTSIYAVVMVVVVVVAPGTMVNKNSPKKSIICRMAKLLGRAHTYPYTHIHFDDTIPGLCLPRE